MPHIMIITGEPSGDQHAAKVVAALKARLPHVYFSGTGGANMQAEGVELAQHIDQMACIGFQQALKHRRRLQGVLDDLVQSWHDQRPDLLVLVDYGGFNLRLAKRAKQHGIPVFYFIPPKVWAWGRGRLKTLAQTVDHAAVILPFERDVLAKANMTCSYVGNPSLTAVHQFLTHAPKQSNTPGLTLGLLPGSRTQEVQRLLPLFLEAIAQGPQTFRDAKILISRADAIDATWFMQQCQPYAKLDLHIDDNSLQVMHESDAILIASGTATLEAALLETPMVIAYQTGMLTACLWRLLRQQPWIGLPNILLQDNWFPECINRQGTVQHLIKQLEHVLQDRTRLAQGCKKIRTMLHTDAPAHENTADAIVALLNLKTT